MNYLNGRAHLASWEDRTTLAGVAIEVFDAVLNDERYPRSSR